jgi:hypothetical protein
LYMQHFMPNRTHYHMSLSRILLLTECILLVKLSDFW